MIKRYCDKCGKELCSDKDYQIQDWVTLTIHGSLDMTLELCNQCFDMVVSDKKTCEPQQKSCTTCEHSSTEKESDECYTCSMYYNDNYVPKTERRNK